MKRPGTALDRGDTADYVNRIVEEGCKKRHYAGPIPWPPFVDALPRDEESRFLEMLVIANEKFASFCQHDLK